MFIIFGFRTRPKEIGMGRFGCPTCRKMQTYRRVRIVQYFHVFFVPLFPLESFGVFVQCLKCRRCWKPQVLEPRPLSPDDPIVKEVRKRLAAGTPARAIRTMLGRRGMDSEKIEEVLGLAATVCIHCFRTCSSIARSCPHCGCEMEPAATIAPARPNQPERLRVDYDPLLRQMSQKTANGAQVDH
jgi:hypothetical protein